MAVSGRNNPDRMRRGDPIRADWMNQVRRFLFRNVSINGATFQQRGGSLVMDIKPRARKRAAAGSKAKWAILPAAIPGVTVRDNHLVCRSYDPVTKMVGEDDIIVAKPLHLWRDLFDGQTLEFSDGSRATYTYDPGSSGTKRSVDNGVIEPWDEWTQPFYYDGSVFLIMPIPTIDVQEPPSFAGSASFGGLEPTSVSRESGSWIDDRFEAGMTITVSGTQFNNGEFILASVGVLDMTVEGEGFVNEFSTSAVIVGTGAKAQWMDANLQARFFRKRRIDIQPDPDPLLFDDQDRLGFDLAVAENLVAEVVTGGSISIVAGTPKKLRLTLTRASVTFQRNAAGVIVGVSAVGAPSITSDLDLDECP